MNKCPCEGCIKFAICYNIDEVECSDLLYYICKDGKGPLIFDPKRLKIIELLFKAPIAHVMGMLNIVIFKGRGLNT